MFIRIMVLMWRQLSAPDIDIRHGLIGPGVYASHNYERSHMDGVKNTYELVKAYVTEQ